MFCNLLNVAFFAKKTFGTKYSRMDLVKFVEDIKKLEVILSA